ncbi:uncharacterized protein LOC111280669 [Durio zibethinus]|uniref:Uncharacterized protein LOC111280669 n=1 Tax=Durio zibethinus TaxID=66656 RepID=A0A6P5X6N3_DURZI|nr:uncharacterized protein LOC111280669 [Durio zibethinus]
METSVSSPLVQKNFEGAAQIGFCADSKDGATTINIPVDTLFRPVKVDNHTIAAIYLGNNNFCKSLRTEGKTNCLNAAIRSVTRDAQLTVEEPVMTRQIHNVKYKLDYSRVYDERTIVAAKNSASNYSQQSSTLDGKIELSGEVQSGIEWGETKTITTVVEVVHKVVVPLMTKVTVDLIATNGKCDVPFSFTQRDTLYNGTTVTTQVQGGTYTGSNYYSIIFKTKEEKLK